MAQSLEFGIGISSIIYAEINKNIPFFFKKKKNEIHTIVSIAKKKAGCYKRTKNKQIKGLKTSPNKAKKSFQMSQKSTSILENSPSQSLISTYHSLKYPQKTKKQRYNHGIQQYCIVAECLCKSDGKTENQNLTSISGINY